RAEPHRFARIDEQHRAQIRLFFIKLDVVAVGFGPNLPIDVPSLVACDVLAMLQELDTVAEIRAAMHARQKALDDLPGANLEPGDPCELLWTQRSFTLQRFAGIADHASARLPSRGSRSPAARSRGPA